LLGTIFHLFLEEHERGVMTDDSLGGWCETTKSLLGGDSRNDVSKLN